MEALVAENIPSEAIDIMGSLFVKGNIVDSFKIVCNSHGFSITFHLNKAKSSYDESSPLATPSSRHKSPSALLRDSERRDSYVMQRPTLIDRETNTDGVNLAADDHDAQNDIQTDTLAEQVLGDSDCECGESEYNTAEVNEKVDNKAAVHEYAPSGQSQIQQNVVSHEGNHEDNIRNQKKAIVITRVKK